MAFLVAFGPTASVSMKFEPTERYATYAACEAAIDPEVAELKKVLQEAANVSGLMVTMRGAIACVKQADRPA